MELRKARGLQCLINLVGITCSRSAFASLVKAPGTLSTGVSGIYQCSNINLSNTRQNNKERLSIFQDGKLREVRGLVCNADFYQAKDDVEPTDWTLRLKHGKHTILLFAAPLTPFTTIKKDLLTTLRERYPDGLTLSSPDKPIPIPESINEVALGVPIDIYEPSKGWTELDTTSGGLKECPKSLGLKDGAVIAFAFLDGFEEPKFEVEWSSYEDNFDMEGVIETEE